jgi:hypothetical protein
MKKSSFYFIKNYSLFLFFSKNAKILTGRYEISYNIIIQNPYCEGIRNVHFRRITMLALALSIIGLTLVAIAIILFCQWLGRNSPARKIRRERRELEEIAMRNNPKLARTSSSLFLFNPLIFLKK